MADLTPEQVEKLAKFDPTRPLVVNTAEIEGLEHLVGRFIFRRPTIKDSLKIAVLTTKLKENTELDAFFENLAYFIALFSVVCTEKPQGFDFEELTDATPIFALAGRYTEWQDMFRLRVEAGKAVISEKK